MTKEEWIPIIYRLWIKEFNKIVDRNFWDEALGKTNSHPEEIKEWYKTIDI